MLRYALLGPATVCDALLCSALLRSAVLCHASFSLCALFCSAGPCYGMSRTALLCSVTLCCAVLRSSSLYALLCSVMRCCVLQCSAIALLCSFQVCYPLLRYFFSAMLCYALPQSVTHRFSLLYYVLLCPATRLFAICSTIPGCALL